MVNFIENNAYRILGLDINANQKDILKRYKEIINRLKIDDYPEYDLDIKLSNKIRNESSVSDALKRLQSQKTGIREYFFWFQINDKIDEKALKYIQDGDSKEAIQLWENSSKSESAGSYFYKKNLALLYCLLLFEKSNHIYLKESLSLWHEILSSEKFWAFFIKKYTSNNEEIINQDLIQEFKNNVAMQISDVYTELHKKYKDNKYVKDFQEVFGTHGEKTEKNVLQPIYENIYESLDKLKKIDINDDGKFDEKDIKSIDDIVRKIRQDLKELEAMGSYENDQSRVVRDRVAETIRELSVSIHNHTSFLRESSDLLKIAIKISGTESLKEKFEVDHKQIKKNEKGMLTVDMSGWFSDKKLIFYPTFLEYKDKKILYRDIEGVSYIATAGDWGTTYKFKLNTQDDEIELSPGEESWNQLIGISKQVIEPLIIQKIIQQIFEKNHTYMIGDVKFNKRGYSRDKFWGGTEEVLWKGEMFIPQYSAGQVVLFKEEEDGDAAQFSKISMDEKNSVILPELITACAQYSHIYGKMKGVKKNNQDKGDTNSEDGEDSKKSGKYYTWDCEHCGKEFKTEEEAVKHEKNCKKGKGWLFSG